MKHATYKKQLDKAHVLACLLWGNIAAIAYNRGAEARGYMLAYAHKVYMQAMGASLNDDLMLLLHYINRLKFIQNAIF